MSETMLLDLPNDVLLRILGRLPPDDVVQCSLVSRRLRSIALDDRLWMRAGAHLVSVRSARGTTWFEKFHRAAWFRRSIRFDQGRESILAPGRVKAMEAIPLQTTSRPAGSIDRIAADPCAGDRLFFASSSSSLSRTPVPPRLTRPPMTVRVGYLRRGPGTGLSLAEGHVITGGDRIRSLVALPADAGETTIVVAADRSGRVTVLAFPKCDDTGNGTGNDDGGRGGGFRCRVIATLPPAVEGRSPGSIDARTHASLIGLGPRPTAVAVVRTSRTPASITCDLVNLTPGDDTVGAHFRAEIPGDRPSMPVAWYTDAKDSDGIDGRTGGVMLATAHVSGTVRFWSVPGTGINECGNEKKTRQAAQLLEVASLPIWEGSVADMAPWDRDAVIVATTLGTVEILRHFEEGDAGGTVTVVANLAPGSIPRTIIAMDGVVLCAGSTPWIFAPGDPGGVYPVPIRAANAPEYSDASLSGDTAFLLTTAGAILSTWKI